MQLSIEKVRIDDSIIEYIVEIIYRTREDPRAIVRGKQAGLANEIIEELVVV